MTEQVKFSCRGCGSGLEYSAGTQALRCPYCATVTEIPAAQDELAPEVAQALIPLSVERNDLIDSVYQHLASGKYTPDNLLEHAVFSKVERLYVPAYAYTGQFEAEWTATFGYDRTEHYTVYEKDSQGHSRPVTRTRTVTDWRPVSGTDSGSFAAVGYAGTRLLESPLAPATLVETCAGAGNLKPYDSSYLAGLEAEAFASTESEVFDSRAMSHVNEVIDASVREHAQGDRQRDWHWTARYDKQATSLLVPVCHVVYEYEGKSFHVWTDGTDSSRMATDALPVDEQRKKTVLAGFAPAIMAGIALPTMGLLTGGGVTDAFSSLTAGVVGLAAGYGFWRRHAILAYSQQLRQSLLSQRKAASANTAAMGEEEREQLAQTIKRPSKPWIADTLRDRVVLPAATAAALVGVVSPAVLQNITWSPSTRDSSSVAVQAEVAATPAPGAATQPPAAASQVMATAQPETPATQEQQAEPAPPSAAHGAMQAVAPAASQPAAQPAVVAQAQPAAPATVQLAPAVVDLLRAAASSQWNSVDDLVLRLKAAAMAPPVGDRRLARSANAEGLSALRQEQYDTAITAFKRGTQADPSDIELANNLGFVYVQAGRTVEGLNALSDVLMRVPDRSSAWANLAEAFAQANNRPATTAGMRLAVRHSANRDKTVDYLQRVSSSHRLPQMREAASRVLAELDSIPAQAGDPSQRTRSAAATAAATQPQSQVPAPAQAAQQATLTHPREACGHKDNLISRGLCEHRLCDRNPAYAEHAYCRELKEARMRNLNGDRPN
jgi:LSD1 subclass zinc finger protein